ncbi:extracellular solute-binding protein [Alsobacter sp. KACC 23698]|uniref:Putrescine-binding periplasmic protein n=1 Tax=Alsobacter sp. KACC 23698 TaxID=3149229 RepID=A0AAU7JFK5_9HYPH
MAGPGALALLRILGASALAAVGLLTGPVQAQTPAAPAAKSLTLYAWPDYFDAAMLDRFTRETGVTILYDPYDGPDAAEARLAGGQAGYDVVAASGPMVQRLSAKGVLSRLDRTRLPGLKSVWPEVADRLRAFDPLGTAAPYMWGAFGIGYNVAKIRERLGDRQNGGWDMAFRTEVGRLKDCGVMLADAPDDIYAAVLRMLALPPDLKRPPDIDRATDTLFRTRTAIARYGTAEAANGLASGEACLAAASSADVVQARKRAREAENGVEIAFLVPREGAPIWIDSLVIPGDAPHRDAAYAFVEFMLRPDVAARNVEAVGYASAVLAARPLVRPEIANDAAVYPAPDAVRRLFAVPAPDERIQKQIARGWQKVKTGK